MWNEKMIALIGSMWLDIDGEDVIHWHLVAGEVVFDSDEEWELYREEEEAVERAEAIAS